MEAIAMGSLLEELVRREAAARERAEAIREQIEHLGQRPAAEEELLSRLVITRETVVEILGQAAGPVEQPPGTVVVDGPDRVEAVEAVEVVEVVVSSSGTSPIGVLTVPRWRVGMGVSVLPRAYQDVLEVLVDAGGAMRAKKIVAAVGLPVQAAKVEGLRSKLKRMVERGRLSEDAPGLFSVTEQVAAQLTR
ncbi:hypothetical protein FHR32_002125 [Streptosporangium album]|uniref:Uncharacterized protein n=1 Tax=Streptosporangium album TaxID=47479 RepID=A0A7W7RTA5_9ACTN|nr:hypothetical protein [Streptosporangium album]MBB4937820.1 hypothetical protein [Streptosporangium album]